MGFCNYYKNLIAAIIFKDRGERILTSTIFSDLKE